jgi:Pyruvate/2-oxoacid:ferredoxin oxidoreductase gamma subunit
MNVVTLGVWAARKGDVLKRDALVEGLRHMAKHPALFELNCRALDRGLALARELEEKAGALAHR